LDLLGVDNQYDVFDDIRIAIEDADMTSEFLQGNDIFMMDQVLVVERYAQWIETLDKNILKTSDNHPEIFEMLRMLDLSEFKST
jgi:hypothetical protein